jgi:anti-anti-sigma regulatory factor
MDDPIIGQNCELFFMLPLLYKMVNGENDMAKNFRVLTKESNDQSLALQLFGDFDGSSACELLHVLDESVKKNRTVAIDTDGLRTINTFGLNVFLPRMSGLKNTRADIEVTGRFSAVFREA